MNAWRWIIPAAVGLAVLGAWPRAASGFGDKPHDPAKEAGIENGDLWVYRQSVALGVPEAEISALVADCRTQGYTTAEVQRILALIVKAKLAGLPHADLLKKLREGLAKRAGPDTIDAALSAKAQTLKRAKSVVDSLLVEEWSAPDYEWAVKVVADALDFGASVQTVLNVARRIEPRPEGMPDVASAFRRVERRK